MQRRSLRSCHRIVLASVCLVALLAACKRNTEPLPGAATEPAAAVRQMAQYLHDNDLAGYARVSVPPTQYAALESAWAQGHSRWPLTGLPLDEKLPTLLTTLSEQGAEQKLQRAFRAQFEGQSAAVRQAAHSLGMFGVQYITHQGDYSAEERAHYVQLVTALSDWAQSAPLSDPKLAKANIATLTAAARATGLSSADSFQQAGMTTSLQRLGPFAAALKQVLASYGLPLDESVAQMRTGLTAQEGDNALVRVQYPLAGKEIDLQVALVRREQHWYLARTLAETDALLAAAAAAEQAKIDAAAAAAVPAESGTEQAPDSAKTAAKP
ncbi:MAG: hypothetical protein ACN6O2_03505 [Stenotrophomonas sp.]|uniref:hypothetical protein n=1 Tax=Stenotrophomonas sp. TaxID=69392 RepID=UPI0028A66E43|nr:hypothetical protein [Stenotrophomonas sp.]